MRKRTFTFDGRQGAGETLAYIVEYYAQVAYPVGGSDCAAASREALQELSAKIKTEDVVDINTRQRPLLKSALNWFYTEQIEVMDNALYERILSQLQR